MGDPLEPGPPRFEIGHADRVLVRHPDREPACDDGRDVDVGVRRDERLEPLEISERVRAVLIVDEPRDRVRQEGMERRRPVADQRIETGHLAITARTVSRAWRSFSQPPAVARRRLRRGSGAAHALPAQLEPGEVLLHLDGLPLDRGAVRVRADR